MCFCCDGFCVVAQEGYFISGAAVISGILIYCLVTEMSADQRNNGQWVDQRASVLLYCKEYKFSYLYND